MEVQLNPANIERICNFLMRKNVGKFKSLEEKKSLGLLDPKELISLIAY